MIPIPAIDLLEGRAVRLAEGDRQRATVYAEQPESLVADFAKAGAARLHVVDLDGAFGEARQLELLRRIHAVAAAHKLAMQVGGGIRSEAAARELLDAGIDAVVIGTLAVREPEAVERLCGDYPGRVIVAIDARAGMVAVAGWTEQATISARELALRAQGWGAHALLFTDVARDGMQVGAAVDATAALQRELEIPVIASGGVGSLEDLDALRDAGIQMVVLGRALYEGNFTLSEAIARC